MVLLLSVLAVCVFIAGTFRLLDGQTIAIGPGGWSISTDRICQS